MTDLEIYPVLWECKTCAVSQPLCYTVCQSVWLYRAPNQFGHYNYCIKWMKMEVIEAMANTYYF